MKIIRRDPSWFSISPFMAQWPTFLDEDLLETEKDFTAFETDDAFVMKAKFAGVPAENIDISVEGGVVTARGEHEETEEEKKKRKVVYREARKAQYLYTVSIPCPVKADKAVADVKNGVLTLTIPKAEEAKPKKIQVTASGK